MLPSAVLVRTIVTHCFNIASEQLREPCLPPGDVITSRVLLNSLVSLGALYLCLATFDTLFVCDTVVLQIRKSGGSGHRSIPAANLGTILMMELIIPSRSYYLQPAVEKIAAAAMTWLCVIVNYIFV